MKVSSSIFGKDVCSFSLSPQITEPATMITDYLLAFLLFFLAWKLFQHYRNFFEPLSVDIRAKLSSLFEQRKQKQCQIPQKKRVRPFHLFWNLRLLQHYVDIIAFHFQALYFWFRDKLSLRNFEIITNETLSYLPTEFQNSLNLSGRKLSVVFYMSGFLVTAVGAVAGGTAHGFREFIGETGEIVTWQVAVYSLGLTTLFFLCGTILAHTPTKWRNLFLALAIIEFVFYALWMVFYDSFVYAILDYTLGAIAIGIIEAIKWKNSKETSGRWIISSIALTFFAASLQQVGVGINEHFNHNDVYHVLQAIAMIMLYLGVRRYKCPAPLTLDQIETLVQKAM